MAHRYLQHIWDTFDLLVFKVILGSFGAFVLKWPVTRKRLAAEQNGVKLGTGREVMTCIYGTFDLLMFKISLGSFGALVPTFLVTRKSLVVKRNRPKFGTRG